MESGGVELLSQLRQMNTMDQEHGNHLHLLDMQGNKEDAPSQEQWILLDKWAREIHGAVTQLMAERAPSMQLLEWIQKRVSDLSDSIKTTCSVIQAWDTLLSNIRDQISHLQKLVGGFSFLKERIAYLQNTIDQNSQSDSDRKTEQHDKFTALHHSMSQHTMTMEEHLRKISNLIIFAQQQETLNQTQNQRMTNLETELKNKHLSTPP